MNKKFYVFVVKFDNCISNFEYNNITKLGIFTLDTLIEYLKNIKSEYSLHTNLNSFSSICDSQVLTNDIDGYHYEYHIVRIQ